MFLHLKKHIVIVSLISIISISYPHRFLAFELSDVIIPDNAKVEHRNLVLQGAGIHTSFFSDWYIGALYLENKVKSAAEALQLMGSKRMLFHITQNEMDQEKFQAALREGISANNTQEEVKKYEKIIKQFIDLFDTDFVKGDIVMVDYIPLKGTQVSIRGRMKGIIPHEHFYSMVLRVWMGGHPPTQQVKKAAIFFFFYVTLTWFSTVPCSSSAPSCNAYRP